MKLFSIIFVLVIGVSNVVSAQSQQATANHDPALTLTRGALAEEGFILGDGHAAMLRTLYNRAIRHVDPDVLEATQSPKQETRDWANMVIARAVAHVAVRYCSSLRGHAANDRGRRISRYTWRQIHSQAIPIAKMMLAFATTGYMPPNPCNGEPVHWGSYQDVRRRHWHFRDALQCGNAHDYFFDRESP